MDYYEIQAQDPEAAPTVFYIPGMLEGGVNKVSTAAEFAQQGVNFIMPVQDRGTSLRNPETGKKDPTYSKAMNMLALYRRDILHPECRA